MKKWIGWIVAGSLMASGCSVDGKKNTLIGAGIGTLGGAVLGGIIGHQSGDKEKGAKIGAAVGGLTGAGIGYKMDQQAKALAEVEAVQVKRAEDGSIIASMKSSILFPTGSAALQASSLDSINQMSDVMKQYPENRIIVLGHTDNKGTSAANQLLSEQRAKAVRSQMLSRGVASANVEAVGQGENSPVASNDTEDGRAQNRRVELKISADPSAQQ